MARLSIPDEQTFATFTVVTSTTAFPISFSLFDKADLTVLVGGSALAQSAFTFTGTLLDGGGYDGGTVTLNTAVTTGTVRIERNVTPVRTSNFAPASSTPVGSIDQALNRQMAISQDHDRRVGGFEALGLTAAEIAADAASALASKIAALAAQTGSETAQGLSEDARDLSQQYASDAAGVSGVNVPSYASRATLGGATVAAAIKQIATRGYAAEGDGGGANYVRTSLATITAAGYPAASYQRSVDRIMPDGSTDGVNGGYWLINERTICPDMLGTSSTSVIEAAFSLAKIQRRPLRFSPGAHTFSPTATIDITGIPDIDGDGATIDASGATSGALFRADGTATLLASAVAITNGGSITATVSTSDLKLGDVLLVVSNETTPATSETSSARKGARVTVASNDGTTILVTPPLLDDYTAAYLYRSDENSVRFGAGLTFIGNPASGSQRTCLFLNFCNARVESKFRGFTAAACTFTNSQGSFTGSSQGMPNTLGLGYGVSCDDLSDVVVNAVITASRHCVKGGGGGYWTQAMVGGVSGAISFPGRLSIPGGIYFGHILHAIDAHATMAVLSVGSGVICGPIVSFARFTQVNGVRMYVDATTLGGGQAMILGSRATGWCDYQIDGLSVEFFGSMPQNTPIIYAPAGTYGGRNLSIKNLTINGAAFSSTSGLRRAVYIGGTWVSVDVDGVRVKYDASTAPALELQCNSGCDYRIGRFSTDGRQIIVKAMQNGAKVRFVEPAIAACAQIALDFQVDAAATNGYAEVEVINPRIEAGTTGGVSAIKIAKAIRANVNGGFVRGNNGDAVEALLTQRLTVRNADLTDNTGNYVAQTDYGAGSTLFEVGNDIRGSAAADLGAGVTVYLQNTATVDPASLATGASTTTATITVTDAALGDIVDASFSLSLAGARITAWVSATNTVSYYFTNVNGANPLDLASGTLRVRVRK